MLMHSWTIGRGEQGVVSGDGGDVDVVSGEQGGTALVDRV